MSAGADAPGARALVLDAAAELLSRRGYEATTVRAIAAAVGIRAASIYHHFPSKDALVAAVVDEGVRVVQRAVEAALDNRPDASPAERLRLALEAHLRSSLEHSAYTSASIRAFAFLPDRVRSACRTERRRYEDVWRGLVDDLTAAGLVAPSVSPDALRLLLLGAVNWAGEWYRPGDLSIDTLARDFASSVLRDEGALRPEPPLSAASRSGLD